jgi:hypothetical protein
VNRRNPEPPLKPLVFSVLLAVLFTTLLVPSPEPVRASSYSITLLFPNGGELLMGGSKYDIKWTTSNPGYGYVTLFYSLDNGASWTKIDNVPNTNPSYTWTVPGVRSTHCRIKLDWRSDGTLYATDNSDGEFTISPAQTFFSSGGDIRVVLAGGAGELNLTRSPDNWESQPSSTADGGLVAFVRMEKDSSGDPIENTAEIWLMDSEGGHLTRITNNNVADVEPSIYPGSALLSWKIVFARFDATRGFSNLYLVEMVPGGYDPFTGRWIPPRIWENQLTSGNHQDREPCFSPDGKKIVFSSNRGGDKFQLYTLDLSNPATVSPALPGVTPYTTMDQRKPHWSPDGKWFACSMMSETQSDIYIADSWGPVNTRRVFRLTQTSPESETSPSWAPDSQEIAFVRKRSGPDITLYELWTMKLKIENTVRVVENRLLKDLGSGALEYYNIQRTLPVGYSGRIGYPSWGCLEGPRISDVELEGRVDNAFMAKLEVFGGAGPYSWSLVGTLPDGLSFAQGGRYPIDFSFMAFIQGTPKQAVRDHRFEVKVVDNSGTWTQRSFTISIRPKRDLQLLNTGRFLPLAVEGQPYGASVQFQGGLSPYQVTVESAIYGKELPAGLNWSTVSVGDTLAVNFSSAGMPTGRYRVKVLVVDNFGQVAAGFFDLNVLKMDRAPVRFVGENLRLWVYGLPEEVGMENYLCLSLEARGIEVSLPIRVSHLPGAEWHDLTAPYPDFSPWSGSFAPGESTIVGKLKLRVDLENQVGTLEDNFPIHRYWFRRDRGFYFPNFESIPIPWDEFVDFFGWEDTMIEVLGIPLGPDPLAWILYLIPEGLWGNCTGMSVSACDIADGIAQTPFSPPNCPYQVSMDTRLAEPDEEVRMYIRKRQWWTLSMEFIRRFSTVIPARSNRDRWSNKVLEDIAGHGLPCYIVMFKGTTSAHTVTAYAMEDLPDGRKLIRVYDSNKPFRYEETSDQDSAIYIDPSRNNSWSYTMAGGEHWGNDWILTVPIDLLRGDPDLPGSLDLPELIGDWTFFALIGSAEPTQVTDNEGHPSFTQEGGLNLDPDTSMPYCLPMPFPSGENRFSGGLYFTPGKPHRIDLSGRESGEYHFIYMPRNGMLLNFSVDTSEGSEDHITFDPRQLSTTFSTPDSKRFCYRMARDLKDRGIHRMFILDNIQTHSGDVTFSTTPEGDAIFVRNDGAATSYDLWVEYIVENEGIQVFERENIPLNRNETQRVTFASWENLQASGKLEIDRDGDGTWDETLELALQGGKPSGLGTGVKLLTVITVALVAGMILVLLKRAKRP